VHNLLGWAFLEIAMRDWLMIIVPIGVGLYFILNPSQFTAFVDWISGFLH
jgi:hypothetical protein